MEFLRKLAGEGLRYVLIGGSTTAAQLVLIWWLTTPLGATRAFILAWALSTFASTLGHRCFTFRRHRRARFDQIVGYVTGLASLGLNSLVLWLVDPHDGARSALIVAVINAVIGTMRFLILRIWFTGSVRHPSSPGPAPQ